MITMSASASDPDGDSLRKVWQSSSFSTYTLMGYMLNKNFPSPSGDSFSFTAPALARTAIMPYAVFDTLSGLAPLTVNIDMTGIQVLPADLYPPVRLLLKPTLVRERTPSHTWIFS